MSGRVLPVTATADAGRGKNSASGGHNRRENDQEMRQGHVPSVSHFLAACIPAPAGG
jgi:hypothetical protein